MRSRLTRAHPGLARRVAAAFVAASLAVLAPAGPSFAAASGSIVYDPTNWVENARSALMAVEQYSQQLRDYAVQINQVQMAVQQLRTLTPAQFAAQMLANNTEAAAVANTITAYSQLKGTMQTAINTISTRRDAASLSGQSWEQYTSMVARQIQANNAAARYRVQREREVLDQVNEDYSVARQLQAQISGSVGSHQAAQVANQQMNRLLAINARMSGIMANALAQKDEDTINRDEERAAQDAASANANAAYQEMIQRSRSLIP